MKQFLARGFQVLDAGGELGGVEADHGPVVDIRHGRHGLHHLHDGLQQVFQRLAFDVGQVNAGERILGLFAIGEAIGTAPVHFEVGVGGAFDGGGRVPEVHACGAGLGKEGAIDEQVGLVLEIV